MDSFDHFGLDMWSRARFSGDWGGGRAVEVRINGIGKNED